jgi:hydrogenase maturation protein HypF
MAENQLEPPVLGVAWDGTGLGSDGTIWGGEFLLINESDFERAGCFRPFLLPGGDAAVREPRRAALGLLFELFGAALFSRPDLRLLDRFNPTELAVLKQMLTGRLNSALTSSAGRLFDAVASIAGLRDKSSFEGQAAMDLEFAIGEFESSACYPFEIRPGNSGSGAGPLVFDWGPMIRELLADLDREAAPAAAAVKFHNTLAEAVVAMARRVGQERVVLSGGCFQNQYLSEQTVRRLERAGFRPYWHQRIPPNDGGIALGQVVAAWRTKR